MNGGDEEMGTAFTDLEDEAIDGGPEEMAVEVGVSSSSRYARLWFAPINGTRKCGLCSMLVNLMLFLLFFVCCFVRFNKPK